MMYAIKVTVVAFMVLVLKWADTHHSGLGFSYDFYQIQEESSSEGAVLDDFHPQPTQTNEENWVDKPWFFKSLTGLLGAIGCYILIYGFGSHSQSKKQAATRERSERLSNQERVTTERIKKNSARIQAVKSKIPDEDGEKASSKKSERSEESEVFQTKRKKSKIRTKTVKFYNVRPIKGIFSDLFLTSHSTKAAECYVIFRDEKKPEQATFEPSKQPDKMAFALNGLQRNLYDACIYKLHPDITVKPIGYEILEKGQLTRTEEGWMIVNKCKLKLLYDE